MCASRSPTAMPTREMTQLAETQACSKLPSTPQTFTSPSQEGEPPENSPADNAGKSTETLA